MSLYAGYSIFARVLCIDHVKEHHLVMSITQTYRLCEPLLQKSVCRCAISVRV